MSKHQYFRNGAEISEAEALDHGLLRDQTTMRVGLTMRDAIPKPWAQADRRAGFTDGSGDPWSASRPGFRVRVGDTRRQAQRDAFAAYDREISSRWKCGDKQSVCPDCDGSGEANDADAPCPRCGGDGVVDQDDNYDTRADEAETNHDSRRHDSRSLSQRMQDHRRNMAQLYSQLDAELENAWRGGNK
jgi:hypothetical protein